MARPLRVEYPGAYYHILNRGLEYRNIFKDDSDFEDFLSLLKDIFDKYKIRVHSYCLMPNHYHLYIETPNGQLSKIMKHLDGVYTQRFNKKYKRVGPLLQGRYKAILIDKESYSLEIARYIHLNPVRAKIVKKPEDWKWSSYRIYKKYSKHSKHEKFLETRWLLSLFSKKKKAAKKLFCEFTLDGLQQDWSPKQELKNTTILGDQKFVDCIKEKYLNDKDDAEMPELKSLHTISVTILEDLIRSLIDDASLQRKLCVYVLKKYSPLGLREIAQRYDHIHYSAISKIASRLCEQAKRDKGLNNVLIKIDNRCKVSNVKT